MGVRLRCKTHVDDLTSTVGVCASCLRQRLLSLIAAHAQLQSLSRTPSDDTPESIDSSPPPPPLQVPCSVSPNYTRKEANDDPRFFSTPQVGPTYQSNNSKRRNTWKFKLSLLNYFFGSKSERFSDPCVPNLDPRISDSTSDSLPRYSWRCPSPSPSWFSLIRDKCRGNSTPSNSIGDSIFPGHRRASRVSDRVLSPANCVDFDEVPSVRGCSDGSPPAAAPRRARRVTTGNVSGLSFCFSPLVRASPGANWNRKGGTTPDIGFSGELRVSVRPHLSQAASFCANRSRKLADFGRVNPNR